MRFLLRLLLLLSLGSYLWSHHGTFIREHLWGADSQEWLNRLPRISDAHSPVRTTQADQRPGYLPRRELTPGAIDPRVTQHNLGNTICRPGYSAAVRPPFAYSNAMKHRLMRAYDATGSIHDYELDHLIPLELGGCAQCEANLWPQSRKLFPGAREKNEVEDYLHHQVCSGALPLAEAQQDIASDWYAVYRKMHRQTPAR
jgi:hypothetical protein